MADTMKAEHEVIFTMKYEVIFVEVIFTMKTLLK